MTHKNLENKTQEIKLCPCKKTAIKDMEAMNSGEYISPYDIGKVRMEKINKEYRVITFGPHSKCHKCLGYDTECKGYRIF